MKCEEAQELITGLVDNELSGTERLSIESHLKDCQRCQLAYRQEIALKREIRIVGARLKAPADLQERILSERPNASTERATSGGWRDLFWPARPRLRPAFIFALLILMILPLLYLYRSTSDSVSLAALQTHQRIIEGKIPLLKAQTQKEIREHLFRSFQGKFAPMEYDLSQVNLRAVGGAAQKIQGREALVTVYEGAIPSLTCYTLLGTEKDAPPNSRVFFDPEKRINFYTFSQDGVNGVLHQEGELICILISKMPVENLLEIARANARPS